MASVSPEIFANIKGGRSGQNFAAMFYASSELQSFRWLSLVENGVENAPFRFAFRHRKRVLVHVKQSIGPGILM